LAVVQVGQDAASVSYEGAIKKFAGEAGVGFQLVTLPETVSSAEVIQVINDLNRNPNITGIMLQTPLPAHMNADLLVNCIAPKKDVEGMTNHNLGRLFYDPPGVAPCTAKAVMRMLAAYQVPLRGKRVTLVGQSVVVGRPLALLLMTERATVTVCNSGTVDLKKATEAADIVIAAVGKIGLVRLDMVKPGAVVIDVGTNFDSENKLRGDVDPAVAERAAMLSAVPGGIGVITVAELFDNLLQLGLLE
jgi:methylenetetrahydrofolate dehydrogenase (NADP+)/methenyltetrahydrofolate cyclohydrolase